MSAIWNILTFAIPGNPIFYKVFRRLLWDLAREQKQQHSWDVCIPRFESFQLPRINSCSQNQSRKQKTPLSDTQTCSHDAQKFRPFYAGLKSSATFVRPSSLGQQYENYTICSGAFVMYVLWRQYRSGPMEHIRHVFPLLVCRVCFCQKAGPDCCWAWWWWCAGKSSDILNFWTPQSSQADSRCQRLTEFIGPKWVCWFNMMTVT